MMKNKKNVHRTGALGFILGQNDIQPVDIKHQEKYHQSNINKQTLHTLDENNHKKETTSIRITELPADLCQPWGFSDRLDIEMGNIDELSNSIEVAGQQEPILVRPIKNIINTSQQQYEIIFGNRRWRACKQIGRNILAIIRDINDQEAAVAQKEENENRQDISDYSKALNYKKFITSGVFSNENQLSIKLNIPRNRLNDLMSYNRIPEELLKSIPNPHNISQRLAIKLASLCKENTNFKILMTLSNDIGTGKISSVNIENIIKKEKTGNQYLKEKEKIRVLGRGGAEIFTIRQDSNGAPCIVLHKTSRQVIQIDELKDLIKNYIDACIEKNFSSS